MDILPIGHLFDAYSNAESLALASISCDDPCNLTSLQISESLQIVKADDDLDSVYKPRTNYNFRTFTPYSSYYLLGLAGDTRFFTTSRKLNTIEQAESSFILAHQALCVYHNIPFYLGPIFGFSRTGGPAGLVLRTLPLTSFQYEISDDLYHPTVFTSWWGKRINLDKETSEFFHRVAKTYVDTKDQRWMLALLRFTSGITSINLNDSIFDFAVAMEALFTRDNDGVSFKLRLYMALLAGHNLKERQQIMTDVKAFYNIRSQLVHGNIKKYDDDDIQLVKRISEYLSESLKITCGRKINKNDIFKELDDMSLIGYPRYSREKAIMIIKPEELVPFICEERKAEVLDYHIYLSEADSCGDHEILLNVTTNDGIVKTHEGSWYLLSLLHLQNKNITKYSYCIIKNDDGDLAYRISEIED